MSARIRKSTAGAPVSGKASSLRYVRRVNEAARGGQRPPQDSKVTRSDSKGPGR